MGRKPRSVRFSEEEWTEIEELAEAEELTQGRFVRRAALSGLARSDGEQMRSGLIGDLKRIVSALYAMHQMQRENGSASIEAAEYRRLMEEADEILDEVIASAATRRE